MDYSQAVVKNEEIEFMDVAAEESNTSEAAMECNAQFSEDGDVENKPKTVIRKDHKSEKFYPYSKKKLFETLQEKGCNSQKINDTMKKLRIDPVQAGEFFNNAAYNAQIHVYEECGSLSYENITDWLNIFEKNGLDAKCNFETALIMKAIADNEPHPKPGALAGVDLRSIYKFLGNALLGLPQPELDANSAKFLANEFENLIDDANSELADVEVKHMKEKLEENIEITNSDVSDERDRQSLDPLMLDNIIKYLSQKSQNKNNF